MVPPPSLSIRPSQPREGPRESLTKLKVPKTFGGGSGMLTGEPRCKQRWAQISEEAHDTIHRWRRRPKTGPRQPQTAQDRPSESPKQPKRATLGAMNFDEGSELPVRSGLIFCCQSAVKCFTYKGGRRSLAGRVLLGARGSFQMSLTQATRVSGEPKNVPR
jgi:hypothetical protein